jgi:two-component system chemotaxis response regulator CheB
MIRILIADDSELTRVVLRDLLAQDPGIEVIAEVSDGRCAVDRTAELRPDLVIMDVMMPVMNGLEAVTEIMAATPTPILMLSASADPQDSSGAFAAIRLGALDVVAKPSGVISQSFSQIAERLIERVKSLSRIRVIHHYRSTRSKPVAAALLAEPPPTETRRLLAIGASTGGPKAVMQLLQGLPRNFEAAVLVVQHISDGFAPGFADWLNRETSLSVRVAADGDRLQPGQVLVAPNGVHMTVRHNRVALEQSAAVQSCRPSVDVLFRSLAEQGLGRECVAVLLTGMGSDGAGGLAELRQGGAHTIVQDEASCVVFGMPRAAIERRAAVQVLPLERIAAVVRSLCGG